ncbi:hypothetical protein SUGI_0492380 [Cryptomeria japonica]|nr:hypothetical protein SUGI_0492380 [Cryptomeria japonica]
MDRLPNNGLVDYADLQPKPDVSLVIPIGVHYNADNPELLCKVTWTISLSVLGGKIGIGKLVSVQLCEIFRPTPAGITVNT